MRCVHLPSLCVVLSPVPRLDCSLSPHREIGDTWMCSCYVFLLDSGTLLWRHNGCDSVSNHQPHHCLLNRLFRRRSKKTSKLRVTGLCAGIHRGPVNSPHKWPVARKMFPFDDVIMEILAPGSNTTHGSSVPGIVISVAFLLFIDRERHVQYAQGKQSKRRNIAPCPKYVKTSRCRTWMMRT